MKHAVVFLDLDGTLIEPSRGIFACIRYALDALGEPCPDEPTLLEWVGPPLRSSFARLLGDGRADAAVAAYRERYSDVGWRECTLYPGVTTMIETMIAAGYTPVLATSKPGLYAEQIVRLHGLDQQLADICGAEFDGRRSHKEELLAYANARHENRGVAMLGDRRYDVSGAKANGLAAFGAAWGFGGSKELTDAGVDRLFDTPADVTAAIARLDVRCRQRGYASPRR